MVQPLGRAADPDGAASPAIDAEAFNRFEAAGWEERAGSYGFLSRGTDELVLRRGHLAPAAEPEEPDLV